MTFTISGTQFKVILTSLELPLWPIHLHSCPANAGCHHPAAGDRGIFHLKLILYMVQLT